MFQIECLTSLPVVRVTSITSYYPEPPVFLSSGTVWSYIHLHWNRSSRPIDPRPLSCPSLLIPRGTVAYVVGARS